MVVALRSAIRSSAPLAFAVRRVATSSFQPACTNGWTTRKTMAEGSIASSNASKTMQGAARSTRCRTALRFRRSPRCRRTGRSQQASQMFPRVCGVRLRRLKRGVDTIGLRDGAGLQVMRIIPSSGLGLSPVVAVCQGDQPAQQRGLPGAAIGGQNVEAILWQGRWAGHPVQDGAGCLDTTGKMPARLEVVDSQRLREEMALQDRIHARWADRRFGQPAGLVLVKLRVGEHLRIDGPAQNMTMALAAGTVEVRAVFV